MGWLFTVNATRKDVIDKLVSFEENEHGIWETIRHCTRGNVLWSVLEWTDKASNVTRKVIACHLLDKTVEQYGNRSIVSWGYKSMDEAMGPTYYSCPLSYLKEVTDVACEAWREQVRKYHRPIKQGDRLMLRQCKTPYVDVISAKPLTAVYQGACYRIPRDLIEDVVSAKSVTRAA